MQPHLLQCSVGANYFDVCKSQGDEDEYGAIELLNGIKKVFSGTMPEFYFEYPCHSLAEERWFYMFAKKFESNEPLVLIEHHNISTRKKAEQKLITSSNALQQSLSVHQKIMKSSLDVICSIDEEGRFVNVSTASEQIWGYTAQELCGRRYMDFVLEEDIETTTKAATSIMNGIIATNFENRYIHKDGHTVHILWSAKWDLYDRLMYCIAKDVTEKKELQQRLLNEQINRQKQITRATLEAQEKERNYLGGELHDNINQILASVNLQLAYCFENPDADKTIIKNAQENVELAMAEIRNLSHKLITHRFGEELFIPMVNNLVQQLFAPDIVTMNVSHFDENVADEIKLTLYRIIQEHLNNIIKHAGAKHIILSLGSNKNSISVMIEDDGIGFNLNQNRNGVGLTNIYNRVESYNGTVDISTEPGKGCKLKAVLPIC